jgi:uncharacterized protein YegL
MGIFRKKDDRPRNGGYDRNLPMTVLKSPGLKVLEGFREDSSVSEPIVRLTKFLRERFGLGRGDTVTLKMGAAMVKARVEVSSAADGLEEACRPNKAARDILGAAPGDQIEVIPPETLILLIDTSGSMGDFVSGLVKIEATKNAVREFIRSKFLMGQEDRAGIVSFGESATVVEKPTTDYEHLENRAATLFPNGATAMYEGLGLAVDHLSFTGGMKRIVLLTDGVPTTTGRQAVLSLAKKAAALNIVIDTIGVGSPFDFMGYDEALLRRIAAITGGTFRRVIDIQELTGQLRELAEGKNYTYLLPGK